MSGAKHVTDADGCVVVDGMLVNTDVAGKAGVVHVGGQERLR